MNLKLLALSGEKGITLIGAGLGVGVAASSVIATTAGATSIFGITTVASWLGVTAIAATPVGCATAAGALAYGVSRLIHNGGLAEGRKKELMQKYKEDAKQLEIKENSNEVTELDKTNFVISIRDLIDKDVISPEDATELIKYVEQGKISLSHAYSKFTHQTSPRFISNIPNQRVCPFVCVLFTRCICRHCSIAFS
jgi:hypothetical protein